MAMSKQDYQDVACVFCISMQGMTLNYREKMLMWHLADRLASEFSMRNPNFLRGRFMDACKVEKPE